MENILIIDDNRNLQMILKNLLQDAGYMTNAAYDGEQAIRKFKTQNPDLVLLDIRLPQKNGIELLEKFKVQNKNIPIIMITAFGDIKTAVKAMKLGAFDYVTKPFINEELLLTIRKALDNSVLQNEVKNLRRKLYNQRQINKKMGNSQAITKVLRQVDLVAKTNMSIVIQGKSGTGKEVIANLIHNESPRRENNFVPVDCGALPAALVESELFGYEKGAFTGAAQNKKGKFEIADQGTLFLDEITNLPLSAQAKLLRVLQEQVIQKIGSNKPHKIDVRFIAASNLDLKRSVKNGDFRHDLYHRLNEFTIQLPLLKERKDDIPVLVSEFITQSAQELKKEILGINEAALNKILNYNWPGNVRELKHIIKRAVLLEDAKTIQPKNILFDEVEAENKNEFSDLDDYYQKILQGELKLFEVSTEFSEKVEKKLIKKILRETKYNKAKTARILGIDRNTLYAKMEKFQIE